MTEKQLGQRLEAIERMTGTCPICNKPIITGQYAHKISNKEMWRKKYGSFIIDNTLNGEYVCSLDCNASVDVGSSYGAHLEVIADIIINEFVKMWQAQGLEKLTDKLLKKYKEMGVKL